MFQVLPFFGAGLSVTEQRGLVVLLLLLKRINQSIYPGVYWTFLTLPTSNPIHYNYLILLVTCQIQWHHHLRMVVLGSVHHHHHLAYHQYNPAH